MSVHDSDSTGQIARAIADPGKILPRAKGESVARWGARAVEATLEAAENEFVDGQEAAETDADRVGLALNLALEFGQIDGDHHKAWVIDQIVRVLAGDRYAGMIEDYRSGEDRPGTYSWGEGIAP